MGKKTGTFNFRHFLSGFFFLVICSALFGQSFYMRLNDYCRKLPAHFENIPSSRRDSLNRIGEYILEKLQAGEQAQILFADRNNAKISQMAELWLYIAAHHYRVKDVIPYSGGLEPTNFDHRIVASIQKTGMVIVPPQQYMNHLIYYINIGMRYPDYSMFAKPVDYHLNPHNHFLMVGVCPEIQSIAAGIYGAEKKVLLLWDDPSMWDDTPMEIQKYESCMESIATDMFYLMDYVRKEMKARKRQRKKKKK